MKTANYDLPLDRGWHFCKAPVKRFKGVEHSDVYCAAKAGGALGKKDFFYTANPWKEVRVPHDWLTTEPYDSTLAAASGFKKRGAGWYYVKFTLPEEEIAHARLVFEGVLGMTTVYVNGAVAARNASGYNRFTVEIADYLVRGAENAIVLYVDCSEWESWSYEGAGLYRAVYIEFREETRIDRDECFVRTEKDGDAWCVGMDLALCGLSGGETVRCVLKDAEGAEWLSAECAAEEALHGVIPVSRGVRLWSPEEPVLYRLTCELLKDGRAVDAASFTVGFRTVEWDADAGMLLNGTRCLVKGVCCHQDHGGVGAAVTDELVEYRIGRLKSIGVNAYRCAHHAVPESLLDVCDRLGMLVMIENRHFSVSEDAKKQLASLVRTARNHPSVFLYSLFNEEPWQADERGYRIARDLRALVLSLDGTRAVTGAMNGGTLKERNASDALDVIGMNYFLKDLDATRARAPGKVILGTENAPTYATRGEYVTDPARSVYTSYCDDYAHTFSESLTETMTLCRSKPYHAGNFLWSGIDGYGEPQPQKWPSIASHWGLFDLCGFPKSTAHLVEAWYREELTVHLLPHWDHAEGETVRVVAFTNGDEAELCLNGRSLGTVPVVDRRAEWQVPYERGRLRVTVRRGCEETSDERVTAGTDARLVLTDETPRRDCPKVRIVNLAVTDGTGVILEGRMDPVSIEVEGGAILGVSNGDPNGHQPLLSDTVPLFHGRAQVIVSGETSALTASVADLGAVTLSLGT